MRVLHIFDHSIPLHSGYAFRSLAILKELRKKGVKTFHVTGVKHKKSLSPKNTSGNGDYNSSRHEATLDSGDEHDNGEKVDGYIFFRTNETWLSKYPFLNQLDTIFTLRKRVSGLIGLVKPDVIHCHSPSLNVIAVASVAKKYNIPLIYEMRASWEDAAVSHGNCKEGGIRYRIEQYLEKYALKKSDHVVTICEGLSSRIKSWGIPKEKVTIVPNAVDLERFSIPEEKPHHLVEYWGAEDKVILGFIGSFYRYEGLHFLIEAMSAIVINNPNVILILVGGGPEETRLKKQCEDLKISNKVIFTGRVDHNDVFNYYNLIDIFIYPRESIRLTEMVTPLKPLEAMAKKGVVVASDIGGHRELIRNGSNGSLFRAGDVGDLVATVTSLLVHKDKWSSLGGEGRRYIESERTWSKSVERITPVYRDLVQKNIIN